MKKLSEFLVAMQKRRDFLRHGGRLGIASALGALAAEAVSVN